MHQKKKHISEINQERSEKLRQKIMAFFREHPFATQIECANALGITNMTVCRHVAVLRERMREDMRA